MLCLSPNTISRKNYLNESGNENSRDDIDHPPPNVRPQTLHQPTRPILDGRARRNSRGENLYAMRTHGIRDAVPVADPGNPQPQPGRHEVQLIEAHQAVSEDDGVFRFLYGNLGTISRPDLVRVLCQGEGQGNSERVEERKGMGMEW